MVIHPVNLGGALGPRRRCHHKVKGMIALFHAIEALVSAGEKAKAEELVKQLKEKYPDFDAKKYIDQQQAKEGR